MDDQERYQIKRIYQMTQTEGWGYMMAAWAQKREQGILSKLKRATTEMPWRHAQGRLDGFDEAVNLASVLAKQYEDGMDEMTAAEQAAETIAHLRGGPK